VTFSVAPGNLVFGSIIVTSSRVSVGVIVRASGLLEADEKGVVFPPVVSTAAIEAGPEVDGTSC
jgi:hypothetical protein